MLPSSFDLLVFITNPINKHDADTFTDKQVDRGLAVVEQSCVTVVQTYLGCKIAKLKNQK